MLERRVVLDANPWPTTHALNATATSGVVVIDASLLAAIPEAELAGALVVPIDGSRDVVGQISTALEGLRDVPVLRIISHGGDGTLWFGDQSIDASQLRECALTIAGWGQALATDADILLYGCSVASTAAGRDFAAELALLTQADVAASTNT